MLQNDRTAESLIDELKVACTNDGCVWKGEYDNYKKTHKDFCVFRNGGFNTWLNNLTQGIVLTQRNNREESTLDSSPYGHVPKSETLQPYIE